MKAPLNRKASAAIKENFPKIQDWVARGYELPSIHQTLLEQNVLSCSLSNFRKYYYKEKKRRSKLEKDVKKVEIKKPAVEKAVVKEQDNVEEASSIEETGAYDPAAQKRLADIVFRRNQL